MPSKYASALASVRALLGFVAALGITNTLRQLLVTPDAKIYFIGKPACTFNLGIIPYELFVLTLAIAQIIIALRFYLASTIGLDPYQDRKVDYSWYALECVLEGILVAANSYYIYYPVDFVILFTFLFLLNGAFTLLSSLTDAFALKKWGWWNIGLGVLLLALLHVYIPIPGWIYCVIGAATIIVASWIGTNEMQVWARLPIGLGVLLLVFLIPCTSVFSDLLFSVFVFVGIVLNTGILAWRHWRDYFPLPEEFC
jgi:hypothetical protein